MSAEKQEHVEQEMVIYSDGSSRPNPGFIGFGFHGYTYTLEVPKKNYGGKGYRLTSYGYAVKDKSAEESAPSVTPIKVFDGYGSSIDAGTNNAAEVMGIKEAMRLALSEPIKKLLIKTDSEYARKGAVEWLDKWAYNNWKNREGNFIANVSNWKDIYALKQELDNKGIEWSIEWVKGHIGLPGNEQADKLASIGRINSEARRQVVDIHTYDADKYWNRGSSMEKHPLICKPWMYFRGMSSHFIAGEYYFGNIGKDADFLGKRDANGGYAIVQLKTSNEALEAVRGVPSARFGDSMSIYVVNLKALYTGDRASDLLDYKDKLLVQVNPRRQDLYFIDSLNFDDAQESARDDDDDSAAVSEDEEYNKDDQDDQFSKAEPLIREQRPQKLSARVFDCLTFMKEKLNDYKLGNQRHNSYFDITAEFFQIESKLVKKEQQLIYKLKPEFKVGIMSHDVKIDLGKLEVPIRINFGIDMPDRNALKRLETLTPKIVLVVWRESDTTVRFAVVIETIDSSSIWSGFYSNLVFLPTK